MTAEPQAPPTAPALTGDADRVIGEYATGLPGPLLLVIGGLHGNEPSGVAAADNVLRQLQRRRPSIRGRVIAMRGNRRALAAKERFIERDLNRVWLDSPERGARPEAPAADGAEARERAELLSAMEEALGANGREAVVLDLHSTSAAAPPFTIMSDTLKNRRIAFSFPLPVILGLEEAVEGTLLEYFSERGHVVLAVEGGEHHAAETVRRHESVIWIALVAAGLLRAGDVPDLALHRNRLRASVAGLPAVVEIVHRHRLDPQSGFRMEEGFRNFGRVASGQLLARDRRGEIRAPRAGLLILPSYQHLGDDGFFIGREVRMRWLRLSAAVRRLRLDGLLPLMPGVSRHPRRAGVLLADPRVARWLTIKVFHLFGYRKMHREDRRFAFRRRPDSA